jgi:hypothetical protein
MSHIEHNYIDNENDTGSILVDNNGQKERNIVDNIDNVAPNRTGSTIIQETMFGMKQTQLLRVGSLFLHIAPCGDEQETLLYALPISSSPKSVVLSAVTYKTGMNMI